jgi:triphosphatase
MLQDILGAMNDSAIAERLLSEVPIASDGNDQYEAVGIIRGWGVSRALTKKLELNKVWKHFHSNDPFW